jgi:hypothetical protein
VGLAEAAAMLGHDPETLVKFYLHRVSGSQVTTQERMGEAFGE